MPVLSIRNENIKKTSQPELLSLWRSRMAQYFRTGSVLASGNLINLQVLSGQTPMIKIHRSKNTIKIHTGKKTKRPVWMCSKQ